MKYGIIMHKETANLGDDVQSYAAAKLMPHVDYVIDREHLDTFQSDNNEPVGVVMCGWWFWQKWNWPPSKCIVPLLTSMHINNYSIYNRGTPVADRWLKGLGGDYLRTYGPVGVRDQSSLDFFKEQGIETFFSGCITTTLPKQKETPNKGKYICFVDLNDKIKQKAYELVEGSGFEVIELSHHNRHRDPNRPVEERFKEVEEYLTLYQNAHCVITRRLHVTLPCLAMEVPVFSIVDLKEEGNKTRWYPFYEWLHCVDNKEFLAGKFDYDFVNPPPNKPNYKEYREKLIKSVNDFIAECEANSDKTVEELTKTTYTDQEVMEWQHSLMKEVLEDWLHQSRGMMKKYNNMKQKLSNYKKENNLKLSQIIARRFKQKWQDIIHSLKEFAKKILRKK